jgi:AraC-like DNA-binding protein
MSLTIDVTHFEELDEHMLDLPGDPALWTISAIADSLHVITRTLRRKFKQGFSRSPKRVLEALVLLRAAMLLATETVTQGQVAGQVGYRHYRTFCRAFKRRLAMTPGEWRKSVRPVGCEGALKALEEIPF